MNGRDFFSKYKKLIVFFIGVYKLLPNKVSYFLYNVNRDRKSKMAMLIRFLFLKKYAKHCGMNIYIAPNVVIKNAQSITIGDNVSIHEFCYLDGYGEIIIEKNVSIAHGSSVISFNHSHLNRELPIKYNESLKGPILIKEDVWVGCGVRILANSTIGNRVIIGANSVVTNAILDSNKIYAGIPASFIKDI